MLIIFVILQISMDFLLNENVLFSDLEDEIHQFYMKESQEWTKDSWCQWSLWL